MQNTVYDVIVKDAGGVEQALSSYKGDVLLIVNVASECGYTKQYAGLEALYREYKDHGLRILAFPSNDFGGQEPGTMAEIRHFCTTNYEVTFELFEKVHAIGEGQHPLYKWLTDHAEPTDDVKWNFEKFLIGRDGALIDRYASKVTPEDPDLRAAIETALRG